MENIILFIKTMVMILVIYIYGSSFLKENDSYHLLLKDYYKFKKEYFIRKILTILFLVTVLFFIFFLILCLISFSTSKWIFSFKEIRKLLFSSYLVVNIYGILAVIFSIYIPSIYAPFIPLFLFYIGDLIKESLDNKIYNMYALFLPGINIGDGAYSLYGPIHLGIIIFLYLILAMNLYYSKRNY